MKYLKIFYGGGKSLKMHSIFFGFVFIFFTLSYSRNSNPVSEDNAKKQQDSCLGPSVGTHHFLLHHYYGIGLYYLEL